MYEGDTKLEDCGSVEVEMRNWEIDMKYVMNGEVGWTLAVRRRKKNARSEESVSNRNLNVSDKSISLMYREVLGSQKLVSIKMGGSETHPYCLGPRELELK